VKVFNAANSLKHTLWKIIEENEHSSNIAFYKQKTGLESPVFKHI